MVGVLLDAEEEVVPPLRKAFDDPTMASQLRLRPNAMGAAIHRPSILFATADFDTEHERDADLAPTHGYIQVSHFFLPFGYATRTTKAKPVVS